MLKKTTKPTTPVPNPTKTPSLRERVYQYLSASIANDELKYNEYLDQNAICKHLNVSRAPLRDALIRLEAESFVTIHSNKGVLITPLTIEYIKSAYQICGSLEASCIDEVFHLITNKHIAEFKASNARQAHYLSLGQYLNYYNENIYFHDIFLSLSSNVLLKDILATIRRRLYDFPQKFYSKEWENVNIEEHNRFIVSIEKNNKLAAISVIRDEHWSIKVHETYFNNYYTFQQNL